MSLRARNLPNRIVIPPMCQYSAVDGMATDWHAVHYGSMALSGAGLLIIEATAVEPRGRISPSDLGLWDDATGQALAKTVKAIRAVNPTIALSVQLAHAGRKASTSLPWKGDSFIPIEQDGWETVAPSPVAFNEHYSKPHELSQSEIESIVTSFAQAANRAVNVGLDAIEIHAVHGYLLHEFLSPLSNCRRDEYGGLLENRMRLILEVFRRIRETTPKDMSIGIRISATDWVDGGWNVEESIVLSSELEKLGCDYVHVSSGGLVETNSIVPGPGYQVPLAEKVKRNITVPVIAVGLITEPEHAESVLLAEQADMVAIGRAMLFNPRWPWHAAAKLGVRFPLPDQYLRCEPHGLKKIYEK